MLLRVGTMLIVGSAVVSTGVTLLMPDWPAPIKMVLAGALMYVIMRHMP